MSDIYEFFEDDTDEVTITVPGAPDLTTATVTFRCRNASTRAVPAAITCTGNTSGGVTTLPLAALLASDPGVVFDEPRLRVVDGADQSTYRITFGGKSKFKVTAALA